MRPFVVNVADLIHRPGARRHEHLSGRIGEPMHVAETVVPADAPLEIDVTLEEVSDGVVAHGTATTLWTAPCRRCLGPATAAFPVEFREMFAMHPDSEGETYPIRHNTIDLEVLAREAILLDLPLAPLCSEACRGLCPTCGADLNDGPCSCATAPKDPRWAALETLLPATEPEH